MRQVFACQGQCVHRTRILVAFALTLLLAPVMALAAPYADFVIDARTGQVLHQDNADTRLHPASLTKMMTLYVAFEAIENGEISLDSRVTISKHAASQPPSKLGLRPGQTIALRYLIRAAAIKSANDAATAIGEAIEGSEPAFARRMNRTAKAMGMTRTNFVNANGLTAKGHLSTARDMTTLGRHVFYDYPQYYNLFSRTTADAGVARVAHTNRRFLAAYKGADGIKTGYTSAAGFNLTASAQRGNKRVIVTVFGGKSTASRNARVAELMDLGFAKSPRRVALQKPARPPYLGGGADEDPAFVVAEAATGSKTMAAGKTIRLNTAVKVSLIPKRRPVPGANPPVEEAPAANDLLIAMQDTIDDVLTEAQGKPASAPVVVAEAAPEAADTAAEPVETVADVSTPDVAEAPEPAEETALAEAEPAPPEPAFVQSTTPQPETLAAVEASAAQPAPIGAEESSDIAEAEPGAEEVSDPLAAVVALALASAEAPATSPRPLPSPVVAETVVAQAAPSSEPEVLPAEAAPAETDIAPEADIVIAAPAPASAPEPAPEQIVLASLSTPEVTPSENLEVVTRVSTSGGREWSVNVGHFGSRYDAERQLLKTALVEMNTLDEALRKVVARRGGYDANFVGMTEEMAQLACRRLQARQTECAVVGP